MFPFVSSRIHGGLDYLLGFLLILGPRLLGLQVGGDDEKIPVILGVSMLAYCLITRYELGLFKVIPFKLHLAFDFLSGAVLATSPWVFGFSTRVWLPHLAGGALLMVAAVVTVPRPDLPDPMARRGMN